MIFSIFLFIIVYAVSIVFLSCKNRVIFQLLNTSVSLLEIVKISFIVAAANIISPFKGAGLIIKPIFFKKKNNIAYKITLAVTLIEQSIDLMFQGLVALISFYFISINGLKSTYSLIYILIPFMLFYLVLFERKTFNLLSRLISLSEKIIPSRIAYFLSNKFRMKKDDFLKLLVNIQQNRKKTNYIIHIILFSLLIIFVSPFLVSSLFPVYSLEMAYLQAFALYWFPFFIGKVSGLPGGLGVRDGATVLVMMKFGIDAITATKFAVLLRIMQTVIPIIFGVIASTMLKINLFKIRNIKKDSLN